MRPPLPAIPPVRRSASADGATPRFAAFAYGLRWASDHPLPLFPAVPPGDRPADIVLERVERLGARPGGRAMNNGEIFADGIRFANAGAVFDMFDGDRVRWSAPAGDDVPLALFGTVAGLLLAWRGLVPLHGSAVAIAGRVVLISGESGAGKSTLCRTLIERGGRLVSDDLSALAPLGTDGVPRLWPGRTGIRLFDPARPDDRDAKLVVAAPTVDPARPVRLDLLLLLTKRILAPGPAEATTALSNHLFRPQWMKVLPGRAARTTTILRAAQRIAIARLPHAADAPELSPADKADAVIALLRGETRPAINALGDIARS